MYIRNGNPLKAGDKDFDSNFIYFCEHGNETPNTIISEKFLRYTRDNNFLKECLRSWLYRALQEESTILRENVP